MKKRQKQIMRKTTIINQHDKVRCASTIDHFLENYINCNLLYRMRITPSSNDPTGNQIPQLTMINLTFANPNQLQTLPKPSLCLNTTHFKQTNTKTLFDTFNYTDFSHNEDEQYSNYLKEYQTLIKGSRKKDVPSPQQHSKEMNLLINQFLSDISGPPTAQQEKAQAKTLVPSKNTARVEKIQIDLNAFQIGKSSQKSQKKMNNDSSISKKKKEVTPRFININEMKANAKKNQQTREKSSSKKEIQVIKVTNLGAKANNHQFQRHIQKVVIAKNPNKLPKREEKPVKSQREQLNQSNSQYSYSKNRAIRQTKASIMKNDKPIEKQEIAENPKKPLKIQIQIPLQELSPHDPQRSGSKDEHLKELDHERQQIIKDISHKVLSLLQKSKDLARQGK